MLTRPSAALKNGASSTDELIGVPLAARRKGDIVHPDTGWSPGQRALLRFLEQQGVLTEEPTAPAAADRPTNADLFAAVANAIDQQALVDLVAQVLRIGTVDLATFTPMADVAALVPAEVARRGEVVPISQQDGTLEVAAANPLDLETVKTIEFTTGLRVRTRIAKRADVCRVIGDAYGAAELAPPPAPADGETQAPADVGTQVPVEPAAAPTEILELPIERVPVDAHPDRDDEPVASIIEQPTDLRWYDDVRLDEPAPEPTPEPDPTDERALPVTPAAPAIAERVMASPAPTSPAAVARPPRPSVLIVSRHLSQRVALRAAIERAADPPCVLTMRDELEAQAALALGGVALVVVDGDGVAADGRPVWQALDAGGAAVLVCGPGPNDAPRETIARDAEPEDVAARVRALLEARTDG